MRNPFSKELPDERAGSPRQRRNQSARDKRLSAPVTQVLPPLAVATLKDDRRIENLSHELFKKPMQPVGSSRLPMMNLVYPPLKEADLISSQNPDSHHHTQKSSTEKVFHNLLGNIKQVKTTAKSKNIHPHQHSKQIPHSVYINPRLLIQQPKTRKISIKGLNLGWRFLSLALAVVSGYAIHFMWTSPSFKMVTPTISGNVRVESKEFIKIMGIEGKHSFTIMPAEIRNTLLNTFPELISADLSFHFPNRISITVSEREPVLIWKQGGQTVWVDIFGIAMQPRGQAGNWYVVTAEGSALDAKTLDPVNKPGQYRPVADPGLILTILTLGNLTPAGTSIAYDPRYGLGWNDAQGWKVYFGFNTDEFESKLAQYAGIVESLKNQGINPRLISVQYPYAPFYRLEQ
jgi:hypothetical protein